MISTNALAYFDHNFIMKLYRLYKDHENYFHSIPYVYKKINMNAILPLFQLGMIKFPI